LVVSPRNGEDYDGRVREQASLKPQEITTLLERTQLPDPKERARAIHDLCPCEIRVNVQEVWDRVVEMSVDPDLRVRSAVLHTLCDGSPSAREADVVRAVEAMQQDLDVRLRRRARGVMAAYRRTGKINQL
jgi:hypothetical protein